MGLTLTCYCGKPATLWCATASCDSFEVKTCNEECATRLAKRFLYGRVGNPKGGIGPEVGPSGGPTRMWSPPWITEPISEEDARAILKALAEEQT